MPQSVSDRQATPIYLAVASFDGVKDNQPKSSRKPWADIVRVLTKHQEREERTVGPLWSPALYAPGARRAKENVVSVSCLALDFDHGNIPNLDTWERWEYVGHTTFRHSEEEPRWRFVFPFANPVGGSDWPRMWQRLNRAFGGSATDSACRDASRLFFLPAHPPGGLFDTIHHQGEWLDPDQFDRKPVEKWIAEAQERLHEGRNIAGMWLATQMRDDEYSQGETEAARWDSVVPYEQMDAHGKIDTYTTEEWYETVRKVFSRPAREPAAALPLARRSTIHGKNGSISEAEPEEKAVGSRPDDLTDLGNGQRFARMHGDKARYCLSHGWLVYNGKQWEAEKLLAQELGKKVSAALWLGLINVVGKGEKDAHYKWAKRSESNASIQACLTMASSEDGVRIDGNDLDQQPWLFNCKNGTVDLRTGELLKHDPDHLITHLSSVKYRPEAQCPLFLEFMGQIMGGSQPMVDYLQEWLGQGLSGSTALQELLMCIGNGANGKNTMLNAVLGVVGSYGGVTPADWLLVKKHDAHSQEIVMLKGKRLLLADEAEQGRAFNEALIKKFTGGSPLRGHLMGMNDIEFRPEFKVVLLANHKPVIRGTDDGIWRRPPVVPFSVKFHDPAEGEHPVKDLALERKLATEQEGILAWLVRGCLRWVGNDLAITRPEPVVAATREYREEMDVLGNFIDDRCERGQELRIKASHLYKAWEMWVGSRGSLSMVAFADQMKRRGYLSERTRDGVFYHGLDVRDEAVFAAEDWRTM